MVATLTGSYCVHSPPSPRKVGMPLSAEMPAPVSATPRSAAAISSAARSTLTGSLALVARCLAAKDGLLREGASPPVVRLVGGLGRERDVRRPRVLPDGHDLEDPELVRRLALQL